MQQSTFAKTSIPRHRLSMVQLQNQDSRRFLESSNWQGRKRNSSIEASNKGSRSKQSESTKSIGLAFTKHKSRRSMYCGDEKQNRQFYPPSDLNSLKFNHQGPPPKRKNVKSKFSFVEHSQQQPKQTIEMSMIDMEKQLSRIMEQQVKSIKRQPCLQNFVFIERLGKGAFSQVFLAKERYTEGLFAVKTLKKKMLTQTGSLDRLIYELKIQMFCDHPNIAKLYGIFGNDTHIYLLQEYSGKDTLYSLMLDQNKNPTPLQISTASNLISQLASAVTYLHQNSIIHRDIKPQNVLVAPGGVVKLTDFGWSIHNPDNDLRKTFCGTPLYFSPQILSAQSYDETVDIWAVGILTYEMLTGSNPFNIKRLTEIGKIVSEKVHIQKIQHYQARQFISEMLIKERVLRKSMSDLISHPFLSLSSSQYK